MRFLRITIKLPLMMSLIAVYGIVGALMRRAIGDPRRRRLSCIRLTSAFCRAGLRVLNVRVNASGNIFDESVAKNIESSPSRLVVCNHLSYLDVLVISAVHPSVFVTSVEIHETPVLGALAETGGSLFVERRDRSKIADEVSNIAQVIKEGMPVVIFPEATSTNGAQVLPFKNSLFAAAHQACADVIPLCIKYERVDGREITDAVRDSVCWYGDMRFFPHLCRLAGLRSVEVKLVALTQIDAGVVPCRKTLANFAFEQIRGFYQPATMTTS